MNFMVYLISGVGYGGNPLENYSLRALSASTKECDIDQKVVKTLNAVSSAITTISLYWTTAQQNTLTSMLNNSAEFKFVLHTYLRNDSLLDISSRKTCFKEIFRFLAVCAKESALVGLLVMNLAPPEEKSDSSSISSSNANDNGIAESSCYRLISILCEQANVFLKLQNSVTSSSSQVMADCAIVEEAATADAFEMARCLLETKKLIDDAVDISASRVSSKRIREESDETPGKDSKSARYESPATQLANIETEYLQTLRPKRFDSVPLLEYCKLGLTSHSLYSPVHYTTSSSFASNFAPTQRSTMVRIAKEMSSLTTSLPVEIGSGIFVRCDESRYDVLKALIVGPEDTPYANGCFEFDLLLPPSYPAVPPNVQLITTGGGTVRFNPNLYNCGKVCLSLLGTWSGPGWDPKASTLLQVLVSIQSLILVPDPYFNEPGYESSMHQPTGRAASAAYNKNIALETFRYAIMQQMKKPSMVFEDVIRDHFRIKGPLIKKQLVG